jgi:hypothetical protein
LPFGARLAIWSLAGIVVYYAFLVAKRFMALALSHQHIT